VILVAAPMELGLATTQKLLDTIFIGDSGAACHMRYSTVGMFNLSPCQTAVTVGNKEKIYIQAKNSFEDTVHNTDGKSSPTLLTELLYVPDLGSAYFPSLKQFNMILSNLAVLMEI
jgi:hypothetical protein